MRDSFERVRRRRLAVQGMLVVLVGYTVMSLATPMPVALHGDGWYTYLWARTIVFDGDIDFANDYEICGDPWDLRNNPVGDNLNYWNPGPALFWVPILAFDRATHHPALDSADPHEALACRGPMGERAVRGTVLAGILTALFGLVVARRHFGDGAAVAGALGIAFLGPLLYYSTILVSYGHAASSCAAGLAFLGWERWRSRGDPRAAPSGARWSDAPWTRWAVMGGLFGFAMLSRAQNAVLVLLPFGSWVAVAWQIGRAPAPRARLIRHVCAGIAFTAALLLVFFPQIWFWHQTTGSWITVPQGSGYMRWAHSMWHKSLFSSQGLFAWSPVHYLSLFGFIALACRVRSRTLGLSLLFLFAVESYVVGAAYDWNGSVGFPGRRFDAMAVPFMFGLAAFAAEVARWSRRRSGRMPGLAATVAFVALFGWSLSVTLGAARALRTDTARPSTEAWADTFTRLPPKVHRSLGNPLTWPASLPFAWFYDAHPSRWDVVGGPELFHHDERSLNYRPGSSTVVMNSPTAAAYFDDAVQSEHERRTGFRFGPGVHRMLLPIHWPDVGALQWTVTPVTEGAKLGVSVGPVRLGTQRVAAPGQRLRFTTPLGAFEQGINGVYLWVEGVVLIEQLQILDTDPPPSEGARIENDRLRRLRDEARQGR